MKSLLRKLSTREIVEELFTRDEAADVINIFKNEKGLDCEFIDINGFCEWLCIKKGKARDMAKKAEATGAFDVLRVGRDYRIDKVSFKNWFRKTGGKFQ
ncbi:hypothetical protein NSA24_00620 [Clostridioides mangenotii]|uniref:hypothetical protein n=1 Tax=Metaclostridioides mangenotii TaxID=1540 RepID=UPI00214A32EA|nr:hypothetical protein [Clostridioides mangenotii]MCR1953330.1 hypothetical protein [Clostridioides mangenotii]